jgi:ADP-Ribosyltransferase in polyvalent proteins
MPKNFIDFATFLQESQKITAPLNAAFRKWFQGSQVVERGKPKICYHGTSVDFRNFDINQIGKGSGNLGHYGYGFYFSDDVREAKQYGSIVLGCYLHIQKPFRGTPEEIKALKQAGVSGIDDLIKIRLDVHSLIRALEPKEPLAAKFVRMLRQYGYTKGWERFLSQHQVSEVSIDLNELADIFEYTTEQADGVPDYVIEMLNGWGIEERDLIFEEDFPVHQSLHWITDLGNRSREVTQAIQKLGYDGVIYGSEYIVFEPHQIKSTENDGTWDIGDNNIYS